MIGSSLPLRVAAALLVGGILSPAAAVSTKYFLHDSAAEFLRGDPDGISVTSDGSLGPAPRDELIAEIAEPYVWDMALDKKNGDIYVGTGDDGWVMRVNDGKSSPFFQCAALEVLSVLVDDRGRVFAGTAPEGFIYRVNRDGEGDVLFDAEEPYVWDMIMGPDGMIYAAFGPEAVVYRVDPESGKSERFFTIDDHHAVSLAFDERGRLIIGTEGKGLVLRVEPDGRGRVLHDTLQAEVGAVLAGPGGIVWAAASAPSPSPRPATTADTQADGSTPEDAKKNNHKNGNNDDKNGPDKKDSEYTFRFGPTAADDGVLYRIDARGNAVRFWESNQGAIFDLKYSAAGKLLVATGDDGGVWQVDDDGGATLLVKSEAKQVTTLIRTPGDDGILVATANPSSVLRLHDDTKGEGTYVSEVLDAWQVARWGRIDWVGAGGKVLLAVRTGNTEEPDGNWTEWSKDKDGDFLDLSALEEARYLQWRLTLRSNRDDAAIQRVRVSALPNNLPPLLRKVRVTAAGNRFYGEPPEMRPRDLWQALPGGLTVQYQFDNGGDREFPQEETAPWTQGLRQIQWDAVDPNGDGLLFTLSYRREDETRWKEFQDEVEGRAFTFNTNGVPDGKYRIQIAASDERFNPTRPLVTTAVSEAFDVDNTPPFFDSVKHRRDDGRGKVGGEVRDTMSDIVRLEYSVDGGEWFDVPPRDGIFDSTKEHFEVNVETAPDEEHSVLLRGTDLAGNVGSHRVLISP